MPGPRVEQSAVLIRPISIRIPGNASEKRVFDFFIHNTAVQLSGHYDSSFWESLILAASMDKPALRHAVMALGALHEDFTIKHGTLPTAAICVDDPNVRFAMEQYAKAIAALRNSLAAGEEEPLTALMACALFVSFDSLRGWFQAALVHLQSGLAILGGLRKNHPGNHTVETNVAPLMTRLSMQSVFFCEAKSKQDRIAYGKQRIEASQKKVVIPERFTTLGEARNCFDETVDGIYRAVMLWKLV